MIIRGSFNRTDGTASVVFNARGQVIVRSLADKLNAIALRLQRKIQVEKLEGQVLNHRTGKLSNSIRMIPARVVGDALMVEVEGAGGPAWYGVLHEFGGDFNAERHSTAQFGLSITRAGKLGRKKRALLQRVMKTNYTIHFRERSFMRSSLDEMRPIIPGELQQAIDRAVSGGA